MISRQELYDAVWSKPMTEVAKQFGVSGSYMARVCTLLNIPRPHRGYWAKLAVGRTPKPMPLPEPRPGDQTVWSRDGATPLPHFARPRVAAKPKKATRAPAPTNPDPHELIRRGKPHLEESSTHKEDGYIRPGKRLLVDITSSAACLNKALGFANTLFRALTAAGHRVVIAPAEEHLTRPDVDQREDVEALRAQLYPRLWYPWRPTVVYIGTTPIGLSLAEMAEDILMRYVAGEYIRETDYVPPKASKRRYSEPYTWTTTNPLPSGRLRLIAYSPKGRVSWSMQWQETKKNPLPSASVIVKALEAAAVELAIKFEEQERAAEAAHLEFLASLERQKREEDRRLVVQSFRDSRKQLEQVIQDWSETMNTARFLSGVEREIASLSEEDQAIVRRRLELARAFLGTQNPLAFFLSWKTPPELYKPKYADTLATTDPTELNPGE